VCEAGVRERPVDRFRLHHPLAWIVTRSPVENFPPPLARTFRTAFYGLVRVSCGLERIYNFLPQLLKTRPGRPRSFRRADLAVRLPQFLRQHPDVMLPEHGR